MTLGRRIGDGATEIGMVGWPVRDEDARGREMNKDAQEGDGRDEGTKGGPSDTRLRSAADQSRLQELAHDAGQAQALLRSFDEDKGSKGEIMLLVAAITKCLMRPLSPRSKYLFQEITSRICFRSSAFS